MHLTKIDLATQQQFVLDLRAELQKTREVAHLAKEVVEAEKKDSYLLGVEKTEARLAEELSEMYKDYYDITWNKALSTAKVPADSALRQWGSIYYHLNIRIALGASASSIAIAPNMTEQPSAT